MKPTFYTRETSLKSSQNNPVLQTGSVSYYNKVVWINYITNSQIPKNDFR